MIIGLAGGSCTGKTTVLRELEARLGDDFVSLSFDDYFVGTENLPDDIEDWESPSLYRYDAFIRDLGALSTGNAITLETKSRESSKLGLRSRVVEPKRYTIVEGFLIFWDKTARELFDKKIFLELPEDEIIRRRLARSEGTSKWNDPDYINNKLIPGHREYVEPQKEYADLVIDGKQPVDKIADQIVTFLL